MLAVAIATALLVCVGDVFLVCLAGAAKAESAPVFVIVATTLVWYSLFEVAQYGLLLQRRATRYLLITLLATALNLALNLPLIAAFGVVGAAWATVASYAVLAGLQYRQCPSELRHLPPPRRFAMALAFPAALYTALHAFDYFGASGAAQRLAVGSTVVLMAGTLLLLGDGGLRAGLREVLRARRERTTGR
jgi:O-antigen/teichoic acid export membrane protein